MKRTPAGRLVALLGAMVLASSVSPRDWSSCRWVTIEHLAAQGLQQRVHPTELPAERGAIVDRTGVPLAITLEARDIYADPRYVTDPIAEARKIARVLDLRARDVERRLRTPDATFVYLGRQIDVKVADRLEALGLPGIGFLEVPKRYYPAGPLAPQVLGFVGVDATGSGGSRVRVRETSSPVRPGPARWSCPATACRSRAASRSWSRRSRAGRS